MSKENPLDRLYIASPCNARWEDMQGDERMRMCALCSKAVYNISDMTKPEAQAFLGNRGKSACVRFYRRRDGTIMTDDCPVGLRKIRNGLRYIARMVVLFLGLIFSITTGYCKQESRESGGGSSPPTDRLDSNPGTSWDVREKYFLGDVAFTDPAKCALPPFQALVTGKYALSREDVFEVDDRINLRLAEVPVEDTVAFRAMGFGMEEVNQLYAVSTGVEELSRDMSASQAFALGQTHEQFHEMKTAELYYRLTLKYIDYYGIYDRKFQKDVMVRYANVLRESGRVSEASEMDKEANEPRFSVSDVPQILKVKEPWEQPKAHGWSQGF